MKLTKIAKGTKVHFEVTKNELNLLSFALDEYALFLEYSLKNNLINTFDLNEKPFELTPKIKTRFEAQLKTVKPMQAILHLFF